jgi:hypothetical protein
MYRSNQNQIKMKNLFSLRIGYISSLFLLTLTLSCEKGILDQNPDTVVGAEQLIAQAQTFFDSELMPSQQGARVAGGSKSWIKNKQPQWAQATTFRFDGKDVVEVPLLLDGSDPVYKLNIAGIGSKGIINKRNGVTKALFFKQKDGTLKVFVMRLILDPDYLAVAGQNAKHKQLSIKTLKKDFTGFLQLCSWDDVLLDMYQYDKGKIIASTRPRSSNSKGGRVAGCGDVLKWRWACVGVVKGCCTPEEEAYDPGGTCCGESGVVSTGPSGKHCEYVPYYEFECVPDEPVQPGPNSGGGETGPGDSGDAVDFSNVSDILLNGSTFSGHPCLQAATRAAINGIRADVLKGVISDYAKNNRTANIEIKAVDAATIRDIGGQGDGFAVTRKGGGSNSANWQIALNYEFLSNASEEFIASVVLHELGHIGIGDGGVADHENHEHFFDNGAVYLRAIISELITKNNMSEESAKSLAIAGLGASNSIINTNASSLFGMSVGQARYVADGYRLGTSGTSPCH